MDYDERRTQKALDYLATNYNDINVNNNMIVIYGNGRKKINQEFKYTSMKQSIYKNVDFDECVIENVAYTGSSFENVNFTDSSLIGSSFANCDFLRVNFDGTNHVFEANNFSQSSFESCNLTADKLFRSGTLNALFHNCNITDTCFKGSTIEGTKFVKCNFRNCDFGHLNIDYTMFVGNNYNEVTFPFYQLAYIIGLVDMLHDHQAKIYACVGDNKICLKEYKKQLENLKLFYLDKSEIFPVCNICLAQENEDDAKRYLLQGIENAISSRNFRLISNLCRLACYHGIVDGKIRHKVNKAMDNFIQSNDIPETQLNYYLTYIGKIQTLLKEGAAQTITLDYKITTNTCKKDADGVQYVNQLINDLNDNIATLDGVNGYNITISNYSPFEITVGVITIVGAVVDVGKLIWGIISKRCQKKKKKKEVEKNNKLSEFAEHEIANGDDYIDARIDVAKEKILRLQKEYSGKDLDKRIVAVTQSLKTDLEEFYTKQIMYFKMLNPDYIK